MKKMKIQNEIKKIINLLESSKRELAAKKCKDLIANYPNISSPRHILGIIEIENKDYKSAIENLAESDRLNPDNSSVWYHLGLAQHNLGNTEDAIAAYKKCITLDPKNQKAIGNLSAIYQSQDRLTEALETTKLSLEINANDALVHNNVAVMCTKLNMYESALYHADRAIELEPNLIEAYGTRATVYRHLDLPKSAYESICSALSFDPSHEEHLIMKAQILRDLGKSDDALTIFQKICAANEENHTARFDMSHLLLSQGRFQEGFAIYDSRFRYKNKKTPIISDTKKMWRPKIFYRSILIWEEQGIGDFVLFSSVFKLRDTLPKYITVMLDSRLITLYERSFPWIQFIDKNKSINLDEYDCHAPIGTIAGYYFSQIDIDNHRSSPYLKVDTEISNFIQSSLRKPNKLICGFTWSSLNMKLENKKSIPLVGWLPIFKSLNATFISLQYGDTFSERNELLLKHGIEVISIKEIDNFRDLDMHASLIDACDFLFLVSNTSAHLAGALGKPARMIQPLSMGRLWYWNNIANSKSQWYPSISIYNQ